MLYISRRVSDGKGVSYGVVDTDDDTEMFVSSHVVRECVLDMGLDIKGVELVNDMNGTPVRVRSIRPYQVEQSELYTKTYLLKRVSIVTFKGVIVDISWSISSPVSIRLSDFGTSVGDYLFLRSQKCRSPLTLVFDDKLTEIGERAFYTMVFRDLLAMEHIGALGLNVVFDIQELPDNLAETVYHQLMMYKDILPPIIDSKSRFCKFVSAEI